MGSVILVLSYLSSVAVPDVGSVLVVGLPLLVELAVLIRGFSTREPTDVVLAAIAVPCLFISTWAVVEALTPSGGVYWGGLFSLAAGGLLAFLVVTDVVVDFIVQTRTTG